jgi:hypothetical protein
VLELTGGGMDLASEGRPTYGARQFESGQGVGATREIISTAVGAAEALTVGSTSCGRRAVPVEEIS